MYNLLWHFRFALIAFGVAGALIMIPLYNYHPAQDVVLAADLLAMMVGLILIYLGKEDEQDQNLRDRGAR